MSSVCMAQLSTQIQRIDNSKIAAEKLTDGIRQIAEDSQVAGLSIVVINDNRIVYQNVFGVKSKETGEKLNQETILYAASLTKPLFAYAFLKLVEKRIFDLDKPLYTYLKKSIGEYEKWKDLAGEKDFEKITARMILSHSAGLPGLRQFYNDKLSIIAEPKTRFYYSNEGMNLLGFVVEEYTGQKLESLIQNLVFEPLKMRRSGMIWSADFENNYAVGHDSNGNVIGAQKRTSSRAAGSMVTTATDYAQFVMAVLKKDGLSKNTFEQMLKPQMIVSSERGFGPLRDKFNDKYKNIGLSWGLGWGLFQTPNGHAFFHGGHSEGWQNYCVAYPKKKTAIILMSNSDNFEPAANKILSLAIADTMSPLEWFGYFDKQG
ncbi:MAG: serine hydrolase domain-containing protein [Pyrinomonadaceae bacterium]